VHEFTGVFRGKPARFRVTSVTGHVYSLDFATGVEDWGSTDGTRLFSHAVRKTTSEPRAKKTCSHLHSVATGADVLILWLDCDREGENICFEVIDHTEQWMNRPPAHSGGGGGGDDVQQIYRARFSAISGPDIRRAMQVSQLSLYFE
jgi:DNA topoisomerase-3